MNLTRNLTLGCWLAAALAAPAATFTVTNTQNTGAGSLRQAMQDANTTPGADVINFNIAPGGLQTINITGDLPTVVEAVTLDATTQPGYAGTPLVELAAMPNQAIYGLRLAANNSVIRGLIINRFNWYGIYLESGVSGTQIKGNWIGLDSTGTMALGMNGNGITINSGANNVIGGTDAASRNVISGNTQYGVALFGTISNIVQGNYIGTDAAGTNSLGNGYAFSGIGNWAAGIWLDGSWTNTIGGAVAGAGNLISGNVRGIVLQNNSRGNVVQGNTIGPVAGGTSRLPGRAQLTGIYLLSSDANQIGGTTALARNIISGNGSPGSGTEGNGVYLTGCGGNVLQGNYIGTDASGMLAISNVFDGIRLEYGATGNTIGGTAAGSRNVISGNANGVGVRLWVCNSNTIQGNYIGSAADGATALGNYTGVHIYGGNANNIGGNNAAAGNLIAYNSAADGLSGNGLFISAIAPDTSTNNLIRRNSFFANAGLGIRLFNISCLDCPPYNDGGDSDTGPNNLQNFPVLSNALTSAGSVNITGSINSRPSSSYTIDFYASPDIDPSGFGEGKLWIGSTSVTTDGSGNAAFDVFFTDAGYGGQYVTATATDLARNTSEFSAAISVGSVAGTLVIADASYTVAEEGGSVSVTVSRLASSSGTVTVQYATADGSAQAGSDYTATSGTLTFTEGQTSQSIVVPILNDTLNEPDETFTVSLGATTGGALLGVRTNVTVTIVDNDPVYASAVNAAVTKPGTGSTLIWLPITLSGPATLTGSVAFATANMTAEAGTDYLSTNGRAYFAPGITNVLVPVTVLADGLQEGSKSFLFSLSSPINLLIANSQSLGTIYDGTQGVLQFGQAAYSVNEDGGTATISVARVGGSLGTVSASYSAAAGTAAAAADFTVTNGVITLNNGQTQGSFQVKILNDAQTESPETIQLQLSNPVGTSLGTPASALLTIQDNDYPALALERAGGSVTLWWPTQAASFQLMNTPALGTGWTAVTNPAVQIGDRWVVTNSLTGAAAFYRLER